LRRIVAINEILLQRRVHEVSGKYWRLEVNACVDDGNHHTLAQIWCQFLTTVKTNLFPSVIISAKVTLKSPPGHAARPPAVASGTDYVTALAAYAESEFPPSV
jgi:hypothetical protein